MNWINGPAVISPIQSDIFCRGLGSYLFREHPAARFYNPVDEIDEIVNNLAKIQYRDTESVMSFVGKYGLLGRGPLRIHETRITPVLEDGVQLNDDEEFLWGVCKSIDRLWSISNSGDPLWWIFAHARTVGWCLAVTSILKTKLIDEAVFRKGVRIPFQGLGPPWIAIRDDVKDVGVFGDPEDPYSLWTGLQRLCDRIITDNIAGMRRTLEMVEDGKVQSRFRFNSLIEMVYWHLGDTREGGSVQQCAAQDCRSFFIQTHKRQRYCPPDPNEKKERKSQAESACSRRDRMSRYRNNPTNREKEKRLQRERYHAQKRQGETKREAIVSKHSYCHG